MLFLQMLNKMATCTSNLLLSYPVTAKSFTGSSSITFSPGFVLESVSLMVGLDEPVPFQDILVTISVGNESRVLLIIGNQYRLFRFTFIEPLVVKDFAPLNVTVTADFEFKGNVGLEGSRLPEGGLAFQFVWRVT